MRHPGAIDGQHEPDRSEQLIKHLRELVAALDGRVPRLERVNEVDIARDAAVLRARALERIAELRGFGADD